MSQKRFFWHFVSINTRACVLLLALCSSGCTHRHSVHLHPALPQFAESPPAQGEIEVAIFLIGDAGDPDLRGEPVLKALASRIRQLAGPARSLDSPVHGRLPNTSVIFLGDNIYPRGMPPKDHRDRGESEQILEAQLDVVRPYDAYAYFVPGNHDWDNAGRKGLEALRLQTQYLHDHAMKLAGGEQTRFAEMIPACGDPLPQKRENPLARIIFLNTQWWLHPHLRDGAFKDHVREPLSALLRSAGDDQVVIVVGHHPLESHGPHGGNLRLIEYLFPPLPLARWLGISPQDLSNSKNRELVGALETTMGNRPLIYAAGHEHSLQILKSDQGPCYQLISGAGSKSKLTPVWHDPVTTLFAFEHAGFMEVDILDDRRVFLSVFIPDQDNNNEPVAVFSMWLEHTKVDRNARRTAFPRPNPRCRRYHRSVVGGGPQLSSAR